MLRRGWHLALAVGVATLLAAPAAAFEVAEGWLVRRWGPEHGLPVAGVNALERDDAGYLWLATFEGLVRFDGVRFERIDRVGDLPSRRLTTLWRGRGGVLWMSTQPHHLVRFDGRSFRHVTGAGGGQVWAIGRDRTGGLLFSMGSCLYGESPKGLGRPRACIEGTRILSFAETPNGDLWLGTDQQGLYRSLRGGALERVPAIAPGVTIHALTAGGDGRVWIGTEEGLFVLADGHARPVPLSPAPSSRIVRLEAGRGGIVWAATLRGLYRIVNGEAAAVAKVGALTGAEPLELDEAGRLWISSGTELRCDGVPVLQDDSLIKDLLADAEGSVWVASSQQGLLRLRRSSMKAIGPLDGLADAVYPIAEGASGEVWAGLNGSGLARIRGGRVEVLGSAEGGKLAQVWSVLPEGPDEALIGSVGLWRWRAGRFAAVAPGLFGDAVVRALYRDRRGGLWVGTEGHGIFHRGPGGEWRHLEPGKGGLPKAIIQVFFESRDGSIWIGTSGGGLLRWRAGTLEGLSRRSGFPSDAVRAFWEDPEGGLWVGTEDRGLVRLRLRPGSRLASAELAVIDRERGLPADGVHQILADGRGRLWMSTNRGIFRAQENELRSVAEGHSREARKVRTVNYTTADGMPADEANGGVQSAGTRTREGRLWFPTIKGIAIIDPASVADNKVPPPVVIEGVRRPGSGERLLLPAGGAPLRLGTDLRSFEIVYTALSFADPERVRFRVRLEGFTEAWAETGGQRHILFLNVPPGRYRFRVMAANEHGVWSPAGASLPLIVVPRWWETRAARWSFLALALALAAGALAERGRRQRRRERELERTVEARTAELAEALRHATRQSEALREADAAKSRFFAYISHELRTPLTLLLAPLLDPEIEAGRLASEVPAMRRAAQDLSRTIDQILDLEKAEAGRLEIRPVPRGLGTIAAAAVEAFTGLAERWRIDLACDACGAGAPGPVAAVDLPQIERVLANLLSNALRHTPAGGRVAVRVRSQNGTALLEVADTGQGIPPAALERIFDRFYQVGFEAFEPGRTRGTGIGLALVRELVHLHGGRIEVESEVGRGSTFRVLLPESREAPVPVEDRSAAPALPPHRADGEEEGPADLDPPLDPDDPRQTVLVVDDHAGVRRAVCRCLEAAYRTAAAPDGASALLLARRLLPDLIVADVSMPEMDGFELARRLGADPETAGIPVLFLTARARASDELEGFGAGAVGYIRKPFSADLLRAQVASLLRRQLRLAERLRQAGPEAPIPQPPGAELAARAREVIVERLDDETLGPANLARALAMGRSQLFDRFRDELGTTPAELIRALRLERAHELLAAGAGSVSEVAYAVGFTTLAGFSRAYRARYGESPSAAFRPPKGRLESLENRSSDAWSSVADA